MEHRKVHPGAAQKYTVILSFVWRTWRGVAWRGVAWRGLAAENGNALSGAFSVVASSALRAAMRCGAIAVMGTEQKIKADRFQSVSSFDVESSYLLPL